MYKLSPYKLLWCGDYYYVLGYSEKKSKVINFRVDRIASKPEILDKDIIPMPDDFDIENYTKEVFFMFSGEKVLVDLRCDNSLMKTMVDRFGEDVTTLAYDMTSFRVQTEVSASPTFSVGCLALMESTDTCTGKCERTVQTDDCTSR